MSLTHSTMHAYMNTAQANSLYVASGWTSKVNIFIFNAHIIQSGHHQSTHRYFNSNREKWLQKGATFSNSLFLHSTICIYLSLMLIIEKHQKNQSLRINKVFFDVCIVAGNETYRSKHRAIPRRNSSSTHWQRRLETCLGPIQRIVVSNFRKAAELRKSNHIEGS